VSLSQRDTTRRIVFVAPRPAGESLRGARAVKQLEDVVLLGICEDLPNPADAGLFTDVVRVNQVHDPLQLIDVARRLSEKHGVLERIVTVHETLLMPVAQACEALGLQGMSVSTVRRTLNKSSLKRVLREVGFETARDQLITDGAAAQRFVEQVGFPVVLKPLTGSGGLATWRIRTDEQLDMALDVLKPSPENAVFIEDHLHGQELCIDTITIANEPRFFSICCYRPTILEALEDSRIQWICVMPRDITGELYRDFIEQGLAAVRALAVGNAMTHMEGFLLEDGTVRFNDATLRPAGARIGPMLSFAYDVDAYRAWARVAADGCFDGPWERKYAVGTIFVRGMGQGKVTRVEGIQVVRQLLGDLLVDSRLPRVGNSKAVTYTGDGYITVRHPETQVVEEALDMIARTLVITYTEAPAPATAPVVLREQWTQRLRQFDQQLYKPSWDDDSLPRVGDA
jgi:hypothetical protein